MTTTDAAASWPPGLKTLPMTSCKSEVLGGTISVTLTLPNTPENWAAMRLFGGLSTLAMPGAAASAGAQAGAPAAVRVGRPAATRRPVSETLVKAPATSGRQLGRRGRASITAQAEGQKEAATAA